MPAYAEKVRRGTRGSAGVWTLFSQLGNRLARLVRPRVSDSHASLSYRFLARQIDIDLPCTGGGRTILVSSSVPPAASNEAMLMLAHALTEELDVQVLLLDGTFGGEGVGCALGHDGTSGLMDLVYEGGHAAIDMIQATPRHNISVLPAGRRRTGRALPIGTERIAGLYEQLCGRFDYVLIQQGSIIADTRYLVCAAKADLVLVLVEEGVTPVDELDRCLDVFRSHQISGVRLVLCEPR